jgi:hypothetical protein
MAANPISKMMNLIGFGIAFQTQMVIFIIQPGNANRYFSCGNYRLSAEQWL